jgi:hypothetical protein
MLYSPKAAADYLSIAASSIRNHCNNPLFRDYLSPTATPPAGQPRQLTANDMKVLAFVHSLTRSGATLEDTAARLPAELPDYDWTPPGAAESQPQEQQPAPLVLAVQTLAAQLDKSQAQQAQLAERLMTASAALAAANAQLAAQQAELAHLRKPWLSRLFGR